jgi:hypothetical protein
VFEGKPVYAAWSKNPDTVMTCSSGGVAYELASYFYDISALVTCASMFFIGLDHEERKMAQNITISRI